MKNTSTYELGGSGRPVVGIVSDQIHDGALAAQSVDEKYLTALSDVAGVIPFMIPALGNVADLPDIFTRLDGLVLTGSASNIHPRYYDADADEASCAPFNTNRDSTAFGAIEIALNLDMPLFAICRGLQELNVFLGGSLMTDICENSEFSSHSAWDKDSPPVVRYATSHRVLPLENSLFEHIAGDAPRFVNSLHVQAIARLGERLVAEATAEDGTIEVIRVADRQFAIGVQWHPEYNAARNPLSRNLFQAFGDAARDYRARASRIDNHRVDAEGASR